MAALPINQRDNMSHQLSNPHPDIPTVEYKTLYIEVTHECNIDDIFEEDQEALGNFEARVPAHLEDSIAAGAALGAYHSTIPIKYLWGFEFAVRKAGCSRITPDYEADWYLLAEIHGAYID
jgi:hypothetical protein